ncbi:MAG: hypothetical protein ACTHU0_20255 [Kofleriaceae bacterium]
MTAPLCWQVIAVVATGHGLGTCGHHHVTSDEATACPWTPDPWPEVCDLLVRKVRVVSSAERDRADAKRPRQLPLFGRPLRQGGGGGGR